MVFRRALGVTMLSLWSGSVALIVSACAGGALDDAAAGAPGVFAGGQSNLAGGQVGNGASNAFGGATAAGGSVGHGGAVTSAGATSSGGPGTATGGSGANAGGSTHTGGSGAATGMSSGGATGSGGGSANCTDAPPPNGDTCAHAVEYGWCSQDWLNGACARSCGKCSGGSTTGGSSNGSGGGTSTGKGGSTGSSGSTGKGGATGSGGTTSTGGSGGPLGGGGGQPPRLDSGTNGWASRFWDCCKPACGWKGNVGGRTPVTSCSAQNQSLGGNYDAKNACESGGTAHMCWGFSPWAVSDTLAYGYAAVNMGSDYCGKCFQLQFDGRSHNGTVDKGSAALASKTMIVQAINNGGVGSTQFDLLIPGGGVGDFDACSSTWGTSDLGERYGGFFLQCQKQNGFDYDKARACTAAKCQSVFATKPDLLAGCNWFVNWFGAPDNPSLIYKEVPCPEAIMAKSGLRR